MNNQSIPTRAQRRRQINQKNQKHPAFWIFLFIFLAAGAGLIYFWKTSQIELIGEKNIVLAVNSPYTEKGIKLKDAPRPLAPQDYQISGVINTGKPGKYKITYSFSRLGLKQKISRNIEIRQQEQAAEPVAIVLIGDPELTLYKGTPYEEPGAQVTGPNHEELQKNLQVSGMIDSNTPGTYQLVYSVNDKDGKEYQSTRTIHVASGRIYLTFDDGPNDETTPQFLQILENENIKATFFVTGNGSDEMLKRVHDAGHTIGLHTYTHDYAQIYQSVDAYYHDLEQVAERVQRVTGIDSKLIRFPGGSSNGISATYSPGIMTTLVADTAARGYQYFDWNVSSGDGSNQESAEIPYQNVTTNLMEGQDNVVLMHDTKQTSADALQRIIQFGKMNNYVFEPLTIDSFPAHHRGTN